MQHLTNVISRLLNDPATRAALTSGVDGIGNADNSEEAELLPDHEAPQSSPLGTNDDDDADAEGQVNDHQPQIVQNDVEQNRDEVFNEDSQDFQVFEEPDTSLGSVANTTRNLSILSEEDNAIVDCYESSAGAPSSTNSQQHNEYKIAPLKDPDNSNDKTDCGSSSGLSISDIPDSERTQPKESLMEANGLASSGLQGFVSSDVTNNSSNEIASAQSVDEIVITSNTSTIQATTSGDNIEEVTEVREESTIQMPETTTGVFSDAGIHENDLNTLQSQLVDLREGYIER